MFIYRMKKNYGQLDKIDFFIILAILTTLRVLIKVIVKNYQRISNIQKKLTELEKVNFRKKSK